METKWDGSFTSCCKMYTSYRIGTERDSSSKFETLNWFLCVFFRKVLVWKFCQKWERSFEKCKSQKLQRTEREMVCAGTFQIWNFQNIEIEWCIDKWIHFKTIKTTNYTNVLSWLIARCSINFDICWSFLSSTTTTTVPPPPPLLHRYSILKHPFDVQYNITFDSFNYVLYFFQSLNIPFYAAAELNSNSNNKRLFNVSV